MKNVWRVLKRDIVRLIKVPSAMVVIAALLVLPSVYTWYNVVGFWNPYDNTGNLRVGVVNEDEGGSTALTGELHVGNLIIDALEDNTQLDWVFEDRQTAMAQLEAGELYAVFIVPSSFTSNLLTLTTGDFVQPKLKYYVNEKTGPVSPKITDTGASTLEETINSTFVSTVSNVAAQAIDDALGNAAAKTSKSKSKALNKMADVEQALKDAQNTLGEISSDTVAAQDKAAGAHSSLASAKKDIDTASSTLKTVSNLTAEAQQDLASFSSSAQPVINESLLSISEAAATTNKAVGTISGAVSSAKGDIDAASVRVQTIIDDNAATIQSLRDAANNLSDSSPTKQTLNELADSLETRNTEAQEALDNAKSVSDSISQMSDATQESADSMNALVQKNVSGAQSYSNNLFLTTIPSMTKTLSELSLTAATLSAAVSNQKQLINQTDLVIDQLESTLKSAKEAIDETDGLLGDLESDISTVRADVSAISTSSAITNLLGEDGLNAEKIADFMGSPTKLVTEQLYSLNAYGSAMAPLFMNLTFWIGAFMLVVILKQEVDSEGIKNITVTQRYMGRFILFAALSVIQAIICCAGVLFIGVQAVDVFALFVAAAVASLAYQSIIYALSITLQHIGKGLCVLLVFAQIPGATGLYPIEMTSTFFQQIYSYFPFTYGINAMREAICGFYGDQYMHALGILMLFFVAFLALGLIVRPLMANVNRMVANQVLESGVYNGENVEIPARRYKLSQLLKALADKEEYQTQLENRYARFSAWYPRLMRGALFCGLAIPIALTVVLALNTSEKVWVLTFWLVWTIIVFVFLVVVESLRYSIERQINLDTMTNESILELGISRNKVEKSALQYKSMLRNRAQRTAPKHEISRRNKAQGVAARNGAAGRQEAQGSAARRETAGRDKAQGVAARNKVAEHFDNPKSSNSNKEEGDKDA